MVSCEYITVVVCAVNKLSLIQEEEEIETLIKGSPQVRTTTVICLGMTFSILTVLILIIL